MIDEGDDSSLSGKAESDELCKGCKCGVGECLLGIEVVLLRKSMTRGFSIFTKRRGLRFASRLGNVARLVIPA